MIRDLTRSLGSAVIVVVLAAAAGAQNLINVDLITPETQWRYFDEGEAPAGWETVEFDDSGWASGAAPLGYGESEVVTRVGFGGNPGARHITTYLRAEFESVGGSEPWQAFSVLATVQRDDGAVIYLNGVEVARQNLPEGVEITHDTLALDEVSGAEEDELHWFDISKDLIRDGKNVIAVRVHQARAGSSDLFFDMALRANRRESRVVTTRKHANVAYLELSHPQRIIRYDLEAREWLEPVPLGEFSGAVESFEVDDDGLFFVTENSLAVWEGGTAPPTVLAELPSEPSSPIVLWGDYAYVTLAAVTSYYKSDGSVAAATSNLPGYSYGRPDDDGTAVVLLGGSFERILRMSFHPDGTITSDLTELLQGAPGGGPCLGLGNGRYIAPNGWLIDGETLDVVGSAGERAINIQRAAPGTFVSIRFSSNDDVFLALHDPDTLLPTHWTTAEGSRSMFAHDGAAFVFGEPGPAGGSDLTVSRLTPEDFRPGLPVEEPAPLPVGFGSFRSSQMVAKGGTAYMSTDTHVYRWTAEDGFDEPLSLPVRSRDRVFDAARGLLYVERSGGYGVAQIDLEAWTVPQAFAGIPEELLGIQAAGSGLLTLSERLEWSGDSAPARHFESDGTLLDTLPLEVNVGVSRSHELTWDARNRVVLTGLRMRIPIAESGELEDPVPLPIEGAVPRFPSFGAVSPDGTLLVSDGTVMEYPDPVRVLWELPEQVTQYVWTGTELFSIRHPPTGGDSTLVEKRDGQTGEVLAWRYFGGLAGGLAADGDTLYAQTRQGLDLSVSVTRVIAFRADDLGVVAATPAEPVRPEQPAVISRGTTRLQLGWQNRTDTSEEQVVSYRRTGPVGPWQSITVPGDVSSATVQGLVPDTRYELRVLARNALGSTDWSETVSGETLENVNVPANPPTGLAAVQVFGDAITLVWEDNTDNETGFRVRWSAAGDSGQTEVTADATMARATGLRTGRDYTFTIEAFNDDGTGEPSLPLVVRTLDSVGVPGRVRLSSPTVDGDSVTLTWIDLPNEEGYIVELRGDDGSFAEVARLAFNTTEFFVDGLAGRTSYLFRVRAFNSRGEGVGDEVSASTPRLGGSLSGGFARHAGVHHFGFSEPDRIERFDEGAAAWLDPWPMPGRVQGLAEGDAGMFVTIEDELRPIDPDGGLGEALLAVPDDAVILVTSEYLIVHEGQFAKAYRANDGTPAAETEVRLGLGHLRDGPAPDTLISPDGLHVVAPGGQIVPIPLGGPSISVRSRSFSPDRRMIFGGSEVRSTGSLEQIGRIETQVARATAIGWAPVVYGAASQGLVGYRPDLTRRQSRQLAEEPFLLSANDNAVFAYAADGRDERGMSATIVSASSLGITSTEAPPPSDDGLGFQPRAAFVSGDDLVLLDPDRFRLVRWSMVGSGFGETVPLGGLPMDAVPWGDAGDVMLADVNGAISKIPAGTTVPQPFADLGAPLFGLEAAGEHLLALGPDPGDVTMYRVYCIDSAGVVTGSIAVPPVWRKLIMHWDAASRRLVYGDEPRWVAISAEGIPNEVGSVEDGEFPSLLHEPAGLAAGGRLVTLEGVVADVSEMPIPERFPTLHYLGDEAVAAVDTGSGTTATISGNLFFSEVTLWGGRALEPLRTIELPGEAVGLVAGVGRIVALTKLGDRVGLHVLRAEDLARSGSSLGDAPPAPSAPANVSVTREKRWRTDGALGRARDRRRRGIRHL